MSFQPESTTIQGKTGPGNQIYEVRTVTKVFHSCCWIREQRKPKHMVFVDRQGMSWGSLKLALAGWPYGCNSWCMLWRTVQQRDHVLTLGHTAKLRTKSESITGGKILDLLREYAEM
ncbi:uncharacterized protein LOC144376329 [Ictidomys tridecemlineatus]